jgi:hypothetical protein
MPIAAQVVRRTRDSVPDLRRVLKALRATAAAVCTCLLLACATGTPQPYEAPPPAAGEHHTIALLGASGLVGGYLLQEALARGYSVRALVRTPAKLEKFSGQITIIQGDARDPQVVGELLRDSDVVISALGPVKADGAASLFINTTSTRNVLQAMQGTGISQYIVVSGAAVVMPGDERDLLGWWIRTLAQIGLHDELQDKQAEYAELAKGPADWMLVRCPLIDPEPVRSALLYSLATPPAFRVRAGELARFIIDQIEAREFIRQGPFVGSQMPLTAQP